MSKKSTRVDFACQALRQAIIEQALPPGTKLPEDELGIAELPHLRNVQARKFRFRRDPVTDEELDRQVYEHADREHNADQCRDAHQLRDKLAGVAVEQARDVARHAVPASAVVARSIGKQPD